MAVALSSIGLLALLVPSSAGADGVTTVAPRLEIRAIDTTGDQTLIDLIYTGSEPPSNAEITIDGQGQTVSSSSTLAEAGVTSDAVLVLDNSVTAGNAASQYAKDQIADLQPSGGAISQLGVVTVGGGAAITSKLRSANSDVATAMRSVVARGGAALWDGVALAGQMLEAHPGRQHNLVIVAGSPDAGSTNSMSDVAATLQSLGVTVHVIVLDGGSADVAQLNDLVARQGGTLGTATSEGLGSAFSGVATRTSQQVRLTVASKAAGDRRTPIEVTLGDDTAVGSFIPGSLAEGATNVVSIESQDGFLSGLFRNSIVKFLIVVLAMGAVSFGCYAVLSLVVRQRGELADHLRHYDEYYTPEADLDEDSRQSLATSDILKRAVEVTGNLAQQRGFLVKVEQMLERADLPLRPAEALFFYVAVVGASVLLSLVVIGNVWFSIAAVIIAFALPGFAVDFLAKRRKKKFVAVLPDMLQLLSGTLRAGYSIGQGIEAVSQEVSEPMGKELRRVVTEARLGRHMEEALEAVAIRMNSEDFGWAVMAIRIQREVGGNLAELLMTVADTMTQRERLRRDVAALTAEGRISAIVLGLLPPGLGVVMMTMNPDYISRLFDGEGLFLLGGAIVAMLIGFAWMKKCITIEI